MNGGDSPGRPGGFLLHRRLPACASARAGLTPSPQASTASPAALNGAGGVDVAVVASRRSGTSTPARAAAACPGLPRTRSTPWTRGTSGRPRRGRGRTTGTCTPPCPAAPASPRPRWRGPGSGCRACWRTCRSSITTAWFSRTSRVVSLCRWSRRRSVIRVCTRATFRRAFSRFADPRCFRASTRCARANRTRSRRSWRRLVTFSPVDNVTSDVIPASMPTTASVGGPSWTVTSHSSDTCQRPAASRDTVTVLGSAPSGRGRDQRIASGSVIFANVSTPSRKRNADRVYSADAATPLTGLEPRVPGPFLPERRKRALQVPQALLQRHRRHLAEERQLRITLPRGEHRRRLDVGHAALLAVPRRRAGFQRQVVDLPHAAEGPVQLLGLLVGRVEAVLERPLQHPPRHASHSSTSPCEAPVHPTKRRASPQRDAGVSADRSAR